MRRCRPPAQAAGMDRYLIQRNIPGAGDLSDADLQGVASRSCGVLAGMGGRVQWVHSFVADDVLVCHYLAESEDDVREHARCGGFPVDAVHLVHRMIDPTTAIDAAVPA